MTPAQQLAHSTPGVIYLAVTCSRFPGRLVLGVHAAVLVVV